MQPQWVVTPGKQTTTTKCTSFIIFYYDQQMHNFFSQIITVLHVSTLSCHHQGDCNKYLANLHK